MRIEAMGKRKTSRKSPINGPQKPIDRVSSRMMHNSRRLRGDLVVPDGANALVDALEWAFKGVEDSNSMICLCPKLKSMIQEFIRIKKTRYLTPEARQKLEDELTEKIKRSKPSPLEKTIKGKQVTYWQTNA